MVEHSFQAVLIRFIRINFQYQLPLPSIIQSAHYQPNRVVLHLYWYQISDEERENWNDLSENNKYNVIANASKFLFNLIFFLKIFLFVVFRNSLNNLYFFYFF